MKFLYDNNNQPTAILGITRDITERKMAELALRRSDEKHRALIENLSEMILILDKDGVNRWNSPAVRQYGMEPEDAIGINAREYTHPDDLGRVDKALKYVVEHPGEVVTVEELKAVADDGRIIFLDDTFVYLPDTPGINGIVLTCRDVSARKQAEEEKRKLQTTLQKAQKLEAIGTLAGGIAHDFNNILSPLVGYAELLKMELPENHPSHTYADIMLQSALRARELVSQILAFSRESELQIKPIKLQPIIYECMKLLRSSIPKTIEIEHHIDPDCSPVNADPTKFHQIIMNLATNAFHAMEKTGGKLTVSLQQTRIEQDSSEISDLLPGTYIQLTVADTGIGMTSDVLDNVFDPYFTTKEKGKGTGLGLAVVHGIVKEFGGDIRIFSKPAKGTCIHIRLPTLIDMKVEKAKVAGPILGGIERILVVDDEVEVANMEQDMLKVLGYKVTLRTGSVEALEAFRAKPGKFDLIITDMTMPNMSGIQLAQEIKKIRAGIPIIICTGFSDQITDEKCEALGIQGYLMKPILMTQLSEMIRSIFKTSEQG